MNPIFSIRELSFGYLPSKHIIDEVSFDVTSGKIISILGESGSGKSTLLKLIYGLEDATSGQLFYGNEEVKGPSSNLVPGHPDMKFVPQEFDLMDSIRVSENVGQYLSNFDLETKKTEIDQALETVYLTEFSDTIAGQLSGGQRQRVSIARALATQPKVLLLDEPYSHLDQPLKFQIRKNIWHWAKKTGTTVLLTTHDYNDALGFSDEVIVLKEGKLLQMAPPEELRNQPASEYVASLLGEYSRLTAPEMMDLFQIEIPADQIALIYPDELQIDEKGIEFQVIDVRYRGRDYWVEAERNGVKVQFYSEDKLVGKVGLRLNGFRVVTGNR